MEPYKWMEEPSRLQSMGPLRVGHDWATSLSLFIFMHWRRKWQPTLVFLPGESQGRGSLVGCHLWGRTESDTTEAAAYKWNHIQEKCLELFIIFFHWDCHENWYSISWNFIHIKPHAKIVHLFNVFHFSSSIMAPWVNKRLGEYLLCQSGSCLCCSIYQPSSFFQHSERRCYACRVNRAHVVETLNSS